MIIEKTNKGIAALTVAAIGIVYGDIGTSPLYALKEVFSKENGAVELTQANILGVVSLIIWGLTVIVSLKYVTLILRADNRGEGGIMALLALALASVKGHPRWTVAMTTIGVVGASLFFGDGVITPAISVLSAVEGIEFATPAFKSYAVPITVGILIALYAVQHKGTSGLGKWFGPIMMIWFVVLAVMGLINIAQVPDVLRALNPIEGLSFLLRQGWPAFIALGAIVLAFTGAEALYADLGHFGDRPIRLAWFLVAFPALALNYLGQGAILMSHPESLTNLFFQQLGAWSVYPLVIISTVATVIASQATISGTFSMTHEAISLGLIPRMNVVHTSTEEVGQIYIPLVNWVQLIAVLLAVVGFGSSTSLGAAYGIAVTGTMVITTILTFFVIRFGWKYNLVGAMLATIFFLVIDIVLFSANTLKIAHGGWFPLVIGVIIFSIMITWHRGLALASQKLHDTAIPLGEFITSLLVHPPARVDGTAVFIRRIADGVPQALLHNLAHNKVLHKNNLFLTVHNLPIPRVPENERVTLIEMGNECFQVDLNYGFKDVVDVPLALTNSNITNMSFAPLETSYFVARQTMVAGTAPSMAHWRKTLFSTMYRNARDTADYLQLPPNRVIELGSQIVI
jgi:KUP system potassium uptake protein